MSSNASSSRVTKTKQEQKKDGFRKSTLITSDPKKTDQTPERAPCCVLCQEKHWTHSCTTYQTVGDRVNKAMQMKLCFKCLRNNHPTSYCTARGSCYYCCGPHHPTFCIKSATLFEAPGVRPVYLQETYDSNTETQKAERTARCVLCQQKHWTDSCDAYQTVGARVDRAKQLKLCLKCLRNNHQTSECKRKGYCHHCRGQHNSAFCTESLPAEDTSDFGDEPDSKTTEDSLRFGAAERDSVHVKWKYGATFYRFELAIGDGYGALIDKIKQLVHEFDGLLQWKDDEGDMVTLNSAEDFALAISMPENQQVLRLFTAEEERSSISAFRGCEDERGQLDLEELSTSTASSGGVASFVGGGGTVIRTLTNRLGELEGSHDAECAVVKALTDRIDELEIGRAVKEGQMRGLSEKLMELESELLCKICLARQVDILYQCGHTICSICDSRLPDRICCFCGRTIIARGNIYN